jgi:hypothetical protein
LPAITMVMGVDKGVWRRTIRERLVAPMTMVLFRSGRRQCMMAGTSFWLLLGVGGWRECHERL